jgi:2,3-bisphosphoglycerate-independent phosphoglycerate mutase
MVGHTGNFEAAVQAVATLDVCLGRIEQAVEATGGQMLITADHGNVEQMFDPVSMQAHTAHTSGPVPLVYIGPQAISFSASGTLSDVAPTILSLMQLEIPAEMTGKSLATIRAQQSA